MSIPTLLLNSCLVLIVVEFGDFPLWVVMINEQFEAMYSAKQCVICDKLDASPELKSGHLVVVKSMATSFLS